MNDKRDRLITDNLGLVHSCAHRFTGRGIEYEELYSAGCVGLTKAAKGFDFERGLCFSTYAVPVILGEIRRLFRDGGTVKVSRSLKELAIKVTKAKRQLEYSMNREPTIFELAGYLDIDPEQAAQALNVSMPVLSLTQEEDDGGGQNDIAVSDCQEEISDKLALEQVIEQLSPNDKSLINLRYYQYKTQSDTAKLLGMTQVQVSRREKVILQQLRQRLTG